MRAVIYHQSGELPVVTDVPEPACPDDGVVLRVGASGVCRSDWHSWLGHDPVELPHVPGHEFAGEIVAVGADVRRWAVGDRVTAPFACGCGRCAYCAEGLSHVCPDQRQPGFAHWGSWADQVMVPAADTNVVALPESMSYVAAAALGCRFATSYHAVTEYAQPRQGDWLAVHGCGGVGLSAVMIAASLGARVVAIDVSAGALEAARELGAEVTISAEGRSSRDIVEAIRDASGGGVHSSIDALGSQPTMQASLRGLRRGGRHVQVGLMLGDDSAPSVPVGRMLSQELSFHGSHGMPAVAYPEMLEHVASGRLDPARLVGRVISLDEAPEAMVAMSSPATTSGMTVIDFGL